MTVAYTHDELKAIKRRIICNNAQKRAYIRDGVVEKLLDVVRQNAVDAPSTSQAPEALPTLASTAVQTLGSLCSVEEGIHALAACGGVPVLLGVLECGPRSGTAVWVLKLLAKHDAGGLAEELVSNEAACFALMGHMHDDAPSVALNALRVVCLCARESKEFARLAETAYDHATFMSLLASSNMEIVQQSIQVFQEVLNRQTGTGLNLTGSTPLLVKLLRSKMRQPASETLQLVAAKCIVTICLMDNSPPSFAEYQLDVLATLIDLISLLDRNIWEAVTPMHLLSMGYGKFASTVIELDVVPKLIRCIEQGGDETGIASLNFVRDLSANNESARRQCIDSGILPIVCGKLGSDDESIQLAACQCLHKLSRSIRALKMHVTTTSEVLDLLMEVARRNVQSELSVHITAILANFCSEPNSLRETLMQKGVLEMFLGVFRSPDLPLRLKCTALLGVSALAYVSTREIKQKISSSITLADIRELLQQGSAQSCPDNEILENTLILIRNMSHNFGPASSPLRDHWDLEFILQKCLEIARARMSDPSIVVQCLYVSILSRPHLQPLVSSPAHAPIPTRPRSLARYIAVNAASGRKQEKDAVIESGWHEEIPHLLRSQSDEIREATMWLLQNLIAAPHFLPILEDLSVDRVLESLDSHPNMYIRDRANIVLEEMKKAGGDFSFRERSGGRHRSRSAGRGGRRTDQDAIAMEGELW
mmetsp:Transcript_7042/g.19355  ORF Transcript_7042/g.19355 Transcript_7042/m.19355 type:complete len:708 (+) Transcript_7042:158-2281(+)